MEMFKKSRLFCNDPSLNCSLSLILVFLEQFHYPSKLVWVGTRSFCFAPGDANVNKYECVYN